MQFGIVGIKRNGLVSNGKSGNQSLKSCSSAASNLDLARAEMKKLHETSRRSEPLFHARPWTGFGRWGLVSSRRLEYELHLFRNESCIQPSCDSRWGCENLIKSPRPYAISAQSTNTLMI